MTDHDFCRAVLRATMEDVRKVTTAAQRKAAWAYRGGSINDALAEFHGPDGFYWYGRGDCLYYARALGWQAWLKEKHPEIEQGEAK